MSEARLSRATRREIADALSDDALLIAEGWMCLPPRVQRHIRLLIDDHIGASSDLLKRLYAAARPDDQARFGDTHQHHSDD